MLVRLAMVLKVLLVVPVIVGAALGEIWCVVAVMLFCLLMAEDSLKAG